MEREEADLSFRPPFHPALPRSSLPPPEQHVHRRTDSNQDKRVETGGRPADDGADQKGDTAEQRDAGGPGMPPGFVGTR